MTALANILTSDRIKVDKARQVRVWSGNLSSDAEYLDAIGELLPFYAPPAHAVKESAAPAKNDAPSTSAEFFGPGGILHSRTQNFAFGFNMPRFDVRSRLKEIKVGLRFLSVALADREDMG
jgi:proline iminopeptidase